MDIDHDIDEQELANRDRLAGWWDAAGLEPSYPATTETVRRLLEATEYQSDHDIIWQALNEHWMPGVSGICVAQGRAEWTATDIVALASAFEARRLWKSTSRIHRHKFTVGETMRGMYDEAGGDPDKFIEDLGKFDWQGLLGLLVARSHDPGAVQTLAVAIKEKLRQEAIL